MFLATTVILIVVVALLMVSARKAKLPIQHRVLHIRYLVTTIIFAVLVVLLFSKILMLVNAFFSLQFVRKLLNFLIPSANVSAGIYWYIALVSCIVIMGAYNAIMHFLKKVWLSPLSKKNYLESRSFVEKFFNILSDLFYIVYDSYVVLPPQKANVGRWFGTMRKIFAGVLIAEGLFVGICLQFDISVLLPDVFVSFIKSTYMIPVVSYILLEQVELFLAADSEKGIVETDTEGIGVTTGADFSQLVKVYENNFSDGALICSFVGNGKDDVQKELFEGIQQEQKSRAKNPMLLEALCRSIHNVAPLDTNYINGLIDLVNGEHVAACDCLWGDFDPYYIAYMQHLLIKEKTVLVICDTKSEVEIMKERLRVVFGQISTIQSLWRIRDSETVDDGRTDVFVCTEEQLVAANLETSFPLFYKNLKMVVVVDAYGFVCRERAYFSRIFDSFQKKEVQFVFYLSENNTDTRNELIQRLGVKQIGVCENIYKNDMTNVLLWRSESVYKSQKAISQRLYHDFGVGYTVAAIAAKHEIPNITVLAPENVPIDTYHNLVTEEYAKILAEDYYKEGSINLGSVIHKNDYSLMDVAPSFSVIYDGDNNLIDLIKARISYSGEAAAVLNVVSEPYMLRDYFASNLDKLFVESTGLQLLVPKDSLVAKAPAIALLINLRSSLPCEAVLAFADKYAFGEERIEKILQKLLEVVFEEGCCYDVYNSFSFSETSVPEFDEEGYHYEQSVTLVNEKLYDEVCRMTENFVELKGAYSAKIPINKKDVYNHFLPKQCVVFNSQRYRVVDITNGIVTVEREGTVDEEKRYKTISSIEGFEIIKKYEKRASLTDKDSVELLEAKITRKMSAYFSYPGVLTFNDPFVKTVCELATPIEETKTVPCLHIVLKDNYGDFSDRIANTLCLLFKGAMETFLPKNHKDLLVFSKVDEEKAYKEVVFKEKTSFLPDPIPSDLFLDFDQKEEIDPDMKGLFTKVNNGDVEGNSANEIHLYVAHYSETDVGIITAIAADLKRLWTTIYKYLNWVEAQSGARANYLKFGYNNTPKMFDSVGVNRCLQSIASIAEETKQANLDIDTSSVTRCCSFCGKPLTVIQHKLDDERYMCSACANHVASDEKEIKELLEQAKKILKEHYEIILPEKIKVKFKSANSIRKDNNVPYARILGVYKPKKKEIWIERGGPTACTLATLVHELTHAWQDENLDIKKIELKYLEGHTSYVEVECMRTIKQYQYADLLEKRLFASLDEYGDGYREWKEYMLYSPNKNIFDNVKERFAGI